MSNIIIFLIISQMPTISPYIGEYNINDFSDPIITSENLEYACWNPAAIGDIKTLSFAASIVYTNGNHDYSSRNYKISEFLLEFLGIAFPLNEKISFGFSLSIPYKISSTSSWLAARMPPTEDSVRSISALRFYAFNPIISYKIKETLAIGINPGILVKKCNAYEEYNSPDSSKIEMLKGTYFGIEPSLGIQYQFNKAFRIDLSVKKGFIQGTETWNDKEYSVKEILPLIASLGTKINITTELAINSAVEFINWRGMNFYADGENYEIVDEIRNVFRIHISGEYKIKSKYALRLGIYNDPYINSNSIYKRDQIYLIGGIGVKLGKLKINFAASSSSLIKPKVKETNNFHLSIAY